MKMLWLFLRVFTAALVVYLLYEPPPMMLLTVAHKMPAVFDHFFLIFAIQVVGFALIAAVLKVPVRSLVKGGLSVRGGRTVLWLLLAEMAVVLFFSVTMVATATSTVGNSVSSLLSAFVSRFPSAGLAGVFFAYVVLAPIFEEFLFRGLILGYLLRTTRPWISIPISSLLFAVIHGSAWPFAIFSGVFYGLLYLRYRSIWLCILAHAANNLLIAAGTPLLIAYLNESYPGLGIRQHMLLFQIGCVVVAILFFWMFLRDTLDAARRPRNELAPVSEDAMTRAGST